MTSDFTSRVARADSFPPMFSSSGARSSVSAEVPGGEPARFIATHHLYPFLLPSFHPTSLPPSLPVPPPSLHPFLFPSLLPPFLPPSPYTLLPSLMPPPPPPGACWHSSLYCFKSSGESPGAVKCVHEQRNAFSLKNGLIFFPSNIFSFLRWPCFPCSAHNSVAWPFYWDRKIEGRLSQRNAREVRG